MPIDDNTLALWWHYEEIAMHFNGLIMQYRLQLMGGTGALIALAVFIGTKLDKHIQCQVRALASLGILILFSAAACLDLFYYNELLLGAVDAVLELEREYDELTLSTAINDRFCGNETSVVTWIYLLIFVFIFAYTMYSFRDWCKNSKSTKQSPPR